MSASAYVPTSSARTGVDPSPESAACTGWMPEYQATIRSPEIPSSAISVSAAKSRASSSPRPRRSKRRHQPLGHGHVERGYRDARQTRRHGDKAVRARAVENGCAIGNCRALHNACAVRNACAGRNPSTLRRTSGSAERSRGESNRRAAPRQLLSFDSTASGLMFSYTARKAVATGSRAARMAGNRPPTKPTTPGPRRCPGRPEPGSPPTGRRPTRPDLPC